MEIIGTGLDATEIVRIAAAIGGVIIGVVQNLVVWQTSSKWQEAATFVILLIVLVFRPQGLLSPKKRLEEL